MEKLILYIVKELVTKPDEVSIENKPDGKIIVLKINLNKNDVGKVIGKNGRVIQSIRTIAKILSPKGIKYVIKVGV